jgi:perosamine synthetase
MNRDQLRRDLATRGIETRTFFIPMHLQPIYYHVFKGQRYPVSEMLCKRGFYLPSSSSLTPAQIHHIVDIVREAHEEATHRS